MLGFASCPGDGFGVSPVGCPAAALVGWLGAFVVESPVGVLVGHAVLFAGSPDMRPVGHRAVPSKVSVDTFAAPKSVGTAGSRSGALAQLPPSRTTTMLDIILTIRKWMMRRTLSMYWKQWQRQRY